MQRAVNDERVKCGVQGIERRLLLAHGADDIDR